MNIFMLLLVQLQSEVIIHVVEAMHEYNNVYMQV